MFRLLHALVALFLGFGIGMLLFWPKARDTEQHAIAMAATPLAQSTYSAKALQLTPSSQTQFLTRVQLPTSQSIATGNFARGHRGGSTKAVPVIGEIAGAGKLFEFDFTLPAMISILGGLTVFLDKTLFGPVGKHIAERDESIRKRVASVKGNAEEVAALKAQADQVLKDAKKAAKEAELAASTRRSQEVNSAIEAAKAKLDAAYALASKDTDAQVEKIKAGSEAEAAALAEQIYKQVVPSS